MNTARRSGDGELVAAKTSKIKVLSLVISNASACAVTIRSGGGSGDIVAEYTLPAGATVQLSSVAGLCESAASENIYIAASAGTLKSWCEYTTEV